MAGDDIKSLITVIVRIVFGILLMLTLIYRVIYVLGNFKNNQYDNWYWEILYIAIYIVGLMGVFKEHFMLNLFFLIVYLICIICRGIGDMLRSYVMISGAVYTVLLY